MHTPQVARENWPFRLGTVVAIFVWGLGLGSARLAVAALDQENDANQLSTSSLAATEPAEEIRDETLRIPQLISQLGAEQFTLREQAESELFELGTIAYDAIEAAIEHEDIEIRLRAQRIARSMRARWIMDENFPDVRKILRGYDQLDELQRGKRIQLLWELPEYRGIPAICKIAKFEEREAVAEYAASIIFSQDIPNATADAARFMDVIETGVGTSEREPARWLRSYAATVRNYLAAISRRDVGDGFSDQIAAAKQELTDGPLSPELHYALGQWLKDMGMFESADFEFNETMRIASPGDRYKHAAVFAISEMRHDIQQHSEAAEILEIEVKLLNEDPSSVQLIKSPFFERTVDSIKSRMHFFHACGHLARGDPAAQFEELKKGMASDPTDADVLIAAYLAAPNDEEKMQVARMVDRASDHFRVRIATVESQLEQTVDPRDVESIEGALAMELNQFAWLVANTHGCYQEALASIQRSISLRPGRAGYLDTLSHCYYALGDLENAVETQKRAVELEPYSGQIARALALFENALADSEQSFNGAATE